MESDLTFINREKLPLHPVDVLSDLGMSEEMVNTYFWHWQWRDIHNAALSVPRTSQPSVPGFSIAAPSHSIILL